MLVIENLVNPLGKLLDLGVLGFEVGDLGLILGNGILPFLNHFPCLAYHPIQLFEIGFKLGPHPLDLGSQTHHLLRPALLAPSQLDLDLRAQLPNCLRILLTSLCELEICALLFVYGNLEPLDFACELPLTKPHRR